MLRDAVVDNAIVRSVVNTTNNIESTYQTLVQAARSLAALYAQGQATCQMVRDYNLMAIAVYNTQKAMLDVIRAAGTVGVPAAPPSPTLFYWQGTAGEQAALVTCPVSGVSGMGAVQTFLPPGSIRIAPGVPAFPATLPQVVHGQLGALSTGAKILIGGIVLFMVAAAIYELARYLDDAAITERVTRTAEAQTTVYQKAVDARLACFSTCIGKGSSTDDCSSQCVDLIPQPSINPYPPEPGGWGFFAWIGVLAAAGVGGALLYRKYKRDGYLLPPRMGHAEVPG